MNRKFLANVLAASLVLTMAPVLPNVDADAAQKLNVSSQQGGGISNLPGLKRVSVASDSAVEMPQGTGVLDCSAWWGAHTLGVEIYSNETTVNFYSKTTKEAPAAWNSPLVVIYTADEDKVGSENYKEYLVFRTDGFGWCGDLNSNNAAGWSEAGYTIETIKNITSNDIIANAVAGSDCSVTVKKASDTQVIVNFVSCGAEYNVTVPVEAGKDIYCSITGDGCELSKLPDELVPADANEPTPTPDENAEHLYSGTAWWTGSQRTGDQTISGNGSIEWYAGYYENVKGVTGAFSVELLAVDAGLNYYITTGSDVNAWYAEGAKGDAITGVALGSKNIDLGHIYKITVARSGQDFKITYFDVTANSVYAEFEAKNTNLPEGDVGVHVMAQVGKYRIESKSFDTMPAVVDNNPPLATYPLYTPTPTAAPTLPPTSDDDNTPGLELECGAFWTAHTGGIEVNSEGIAIKFRNVSSGSENWDTPIVVGYSANEPVVNGDGYKEYVVIRSDAYAWNPSNNSADIAAWEASGYKMTAVTPADWASWLSANKSGVDCLVQAIKVGGKVYIQVENNGVKTVTSFAVPDGEKFYVSLSGEQCKLTNIKNTNYTGIDGVTGGDTPSESASPAPSTSPEPGTTPAPDGTPTPGDNNNNNNTPGDNNTPGNNDNNTPQTPNDTDKDNSKDDEKETKKTMKVSGITAKKNTKKVTGTVSVKGAKVKVKVGSKAYKNAKVSGKKFTFTASSKLKKGTKITIKVTKSGYKTVTKTVKVK